MFWCYDIFSSTAMHLTILPTFQRPNYTRHGKTLPGYDSPCQGKGNKSSVSRLPSAVCRQLSAVSRQQSAVSCRPSAVSFQRPAVSSQQSAVNHQQSVVSSQQSAVNYQQSVVSSQQSAPFAGCYGSRPLSAGDPWGGAGQ